MANSIASTKNYTAVLDEVYKRAVCSTYLNSPRRMARAGRNAREINIRYRQDSCALSGNHIGPSSGMATRPAASRPGSASSPTRSPLRT